MFGHDPTVTGAPRPLGARFASESLSRESSVLPRPLLPRYYHLEKHWGLAGEQRSAFSLPMWLIPPLLALFLSAAFAAHRHGRGAKLLAAGHCPTCGYDCRATPQRCPECGTVLRTAVLRTATSADGATATPR